MSNQTDESATTLSSGNVFRDLGLPDPDLLLLKAHLAAHISEAIGRRGWTQVEAAARLGIDQPRISRLMRGHLSAFSIDALLSYLKRLDVKMSVSIEDPVGKSIEKILVAV